MKTSGTIMRSFIVSAAALAAIAVPAQAQDTPVLGNDYIFFVEGVNTSIPALPGASVVKDTKNPETRGNILRISGGAWFQNGFFWEVGGQGGVDFSANIARRDSLFLSVRIDSLQVDGGKTLGLTIADVTNGTDANLQFGITYQFPAALYNNEWHDLVIPLPYETWAKHDSAKKGRNIKGNPLPNDSLYSDAQKRWNYDAAWSSQTFSAVAPGDARFKNVEWNKIGRFALTLNNERSGTIFVDKFWVGSSKADISVATAAASPAGNLSAAQPAFDNVRLTWDAADATVGSFNLYYSGTAITDLTSPDVFLLGNFKTTDDLEFTHTSVLPHPSVNTVTYHYAVATTNKWGYIPPNAAFATSSIQATGRRQPHIFELTPAQETTVQTALTSKNLTNIGIPTTAFAPFTLEGAPTSGAYKGPNDASAKIWTSFGRLDGFNTLYLYMEVTDDDVRGGPNATPGEMMGTTIFPSKDPAKTWVPGPNADTRLEWNFYTKDQVIMNLGGYAVDFITGTTNGIRKRGAKPDYYVAFQPIVKQAGATRPDSMITRMWLTAEPATSSDAYRTVYYNSTQTWTFSPVFEVIMEGGVYKGWRALVAIDFEDLIKEGTGDVVFTPPSKSSISYVPMMFTLVDRDGETPDAGNWWEVPSFQYSYPTRPGSGAGGLFVTDPSVRTMGSVAMAGIETAVANEEEVPGRNLVFNLEQNYPNPFNPSTNIRFSLASAEKVTLSVYNLLGQKVATLVNGSRMNAGTHSVSFDASRLASGMYTYQIEAGNYRSVRKMILVK